MRVRNWILGFAGLPLALLLMTGCHSQPAAGLLPVEAAHGVTAQPASTAPASAPSSLPPASFGSPGTPPVPDANGFSLPIGGEIPKSPATPATPASVPNPAPIGNDQEGSTIPVPSLQPQGSPSFAPAKSAAGSSAEAAGHSIHLSAGIAVPQSLPDGTVMAISVDYSSNAALHPSSRYVLVINSAAGEAVNQVQLEASGNLSAFFLQLKPEHRPFSARIEEVTPGSKRRTVISNELPLKTDY